MIPAIKKFLCVSVLLFPCFAFASQVSVTAVFTKGGKEIFRKTDVVEGGKESELKDIKLVEYVDSASKTGDKLVEQKKTLEIGVALAVTPWVQSDGSVFCALKAVRTELVGMEHQQILGMNIDSPHTRDNLVQRTYIFDSGVPKVIYTTDRDGGETWEVTLTGL